MVTKQTISESGKLKLVALGGTEEIGMNMTLYIYEGSFGNGRDNFCIMVDCGVSFEEMPGANVVMPDIKSLEHEGIEIDAVVLTHGHEDHIGAIPYLASQLNCPIYGTPFTMGLVEKKLKDSSKNGSSILHTVNLGEKRQIGPFDISWISVTHSIPDSSMLGIEVGEKEKVRVLHTGDWKLDDDPIVGPKTDVEALKKFGDLGVDALICDSTNIHEEESALSEGEVAKTLKEMVSNTQKGRFVLTCFSSNVARVKSCFEAARAANRQVLVLGTALRRTLEVAENLGYVDDVDYITEDQARNFKPENLMIICTGSQAEFNSALWKMAHKVPNGGTLLDKEDTLVFSARVIDGRQKSVREAINKFVERGVRVLHPWNSKDMAIHASGHPGQPDIAALFSWVKPKCVIPVHSEAEHRISHLAFAKSKGYKAFNLKNGMMVDINREGIIKNKAIEHGKLVYDGSRLIPYNHEIFKQREELRNNGFVMITIGLKFKKVKCMVSSWGLNEKDRTEPSAENPNEKNPRKMSFNKKLRSDIERCISSFSSADFSMQEQMIRKKVIDTARNSIWQMIKKSPIIGVHLLG